MQIDGYFKMGAFRTPDEDRTKGNGKVVSLVIRDGLLRIIRNDELNDRGDGKKCYPGENGFVEWDEYTKYIMKLEGKEKVGAQMWSTTIFIRNGVREITTEHTNMRPTKTEQKSASNH
ncbi:MAG: hypothetical protein QM496_03665 [Verrucomicrobiota bacterium]